MSHRVGPGAFGGAAWGLALMLGCGADPVPDAEATEGAGSSGDATSSADEGSSTAESAETSEGMSSDAASSTGEDPPGLTTGCIERTWYPDGDGDGWGDPGGETVEACEGPRGFVDVGDDCDDTEALRNPGQDELCGDRIDNDCDDKLDEWSPSNLECAGCIAQGGGDAYYACTFEEGEDWSAAMDRCAAFGAELASIHGGEENDLLAALAGQAGLTRAYLGMVDAGGGRWGWSDGTPVTYEAWADGQPRGAGREQTCAVQDARMGTWSPQACDGPPAVDVPGFLCLDPMP